MELPKDVLLVTTGVDVQMRYIVTLTAGWSAAGELWILDFEKTECDPRDTAVWRSLAQYFSAIRYEHPQGDVPVHLVGLDSGYLTDVVYEAVRLGNSQPGRPGRWWHATKGVGGLTSEPLVLPIRDARDGHGRRGPRPLRINTDEAKAEFYAMLTTKSYGPGYVHIPKRLASTDLLAELTSEELRTKYDPDGVACGVQWRKKTPDSRNEALDAVCIALALYRFLTKAQWLQLLVARFGQADGVARWRERHPGERIHVVDDPPRRPSTWLGQRGDS